MLLRNINDIYVPFPRTSQIEMLPQVAFPKLWNELQDEINMNDPNKSLFNAN
jgi:hypothetical protein